MSAVRLHICWPAPGGQLLTCLVRFLDIDPTETQQKLSELLHVFIVAVTLIVVAVPEGM
jgi:hypothetical protein